MRIGGGRFLRHISFMISKPMKAALVCSASIALISCASMRDAGSSSVNMVKNTASAISSFSFANLIPGHSDVKIVKVREKDLKELPTGKERALAYENEHKGGFWIFGGPVDFKEPNLPQSATELDGSLLPPRNP